MLHQHDTFRLNGLDWRVAHVNASRAHCIATTKTVVVLANGRTFTATVGRSLDLSPNTEPALFREFHIDQ